MYIKLYSDSKLNDLSNHFQDFLYGKSYILDNGKENNVKWFSNPKVKDYQTTRKFLEALGFKAEPASSKEIENGVFSIFSRR